MTCTEDHELENDESAHYLVHNLDKIHRQILNSLATDARDISTSEIAGKVSVTSTTIRSQIGELESNEIIEGYETRIDYIYLGFLPMLFLCTIPPDMRGKVYEKVE